MAKKKIIAIVEDIFADLPADEFSLYELVDVEYLKEGPNWYLRLFIDKEGGIDLADCTKISRVINKKLDAIDPIDKEYILEISSPGVERPLKKPRDFQRFAGKDIEIKLYAAINGKKVITGLLNGFEDGMVLMKPFDTDQTLKIELADIAQAKLLFTFD